MFERYIEITNRVVLKVYRVFEIKDLKERNGLSILTNTATWEIRNFTIEELFISSGEVKILKSAAVSKIRLEDHRGKASNHTQAGDSTLSSLIINMTEICGKETPVTPFIAASSLEGASVSENCSHKGREQQRLTMSEQELRSLSLDTSVSKSCTHLGKSSHVQLEMLTEFDGCLGDTKTRIVCSGNYKNDMDLRLLRGTLEEAGIAETGLLELEDLDGTDKVASQNTGDKLEKDEFRAENVSEDVLTDSELIARPDDLRSLRDVTVNAKGELEHNNESDTENPDTETNKKVSDDENKRLSVSSCHSLDIVCRICHCGDEDEKLISPCACSGSLQFVHESCLVQWMRGKMMNSCELCQVKIEIVKQLKPFWKWQRPAQRPFALFWVMTFIGALVLNIASVAKDASDKCISTPCIIFYSIGCLSAILATIFMVYFGKRAKEYIRQLIQINEVWVVLDKRSTVRQKKTRHGGPKIQKVVFTTTGLKTMV